MIAATIEPNWTLRFLKTTPGRFFIDITVASGACSGPSADHGFVSIFQKLTSMRSQFRTRAATRAARSR
jgi:hypothetical protein